MLLFEKTVNNILMNLLITENSDSQNIESVVNSTIEQIKKLKETDESSFLSNSEAKYNSGEDIEKRFLEELRALSTINEDFGDAYNLIMKAKDKVKEVWKDEIAPTIATGQSALADLAVENMGSIVRNTIGDDYTDEIKNELSENFVYKILAVLEPTGVMSWPYLAKAKEEYEKHIGTEDEDIYQLNLLAAQISVIPGVRVPFRIFTLPFRLLFGGPALIVRKIFGINGSKKVAESLASVIKEPLSKVPTLNKGVAAVKTASTTTKAGKLAKTPASKAITNIPKKGAKAVATASNKTTKKVLDATKKGAKVVAGITKKIAKPVSTGAKIGTVAAAGNIPELLKNLESKGEEMMNKGPKAGTLGQFRGFRGLSTQSS